LSCSRHVAKSVVRLTIGRSMILFALRCSQDHEFEAWFRDGATYDAQTAAGEVSCPLCADTAVSKAPMAPHIGKGLSVRLGGDPSPEAKPIEARPGTGDEPRADGLPVLSGGTMIPAAKAMMDPRLRELARLRTLMLGLKKLVQDNCDYVGPEFAAEARRIHHGEADERAIYGEATDDEAEALAEDGITVGRIPWPSDGDA